MAEVGFAALVVIGFLIVSVVVLLFALTVSIAGARATRPPCPHCGLPARRPRGLCRSCGKPLAG